MTAILHDPEFFSRHDQMQHAENSRRFAHLAQTRYPTCLTLRPASDEELLAVHTPAYLQRIATVCANGGGMLDPDTYCVRDSETVSRSAVGGLIDLCRSVLSGEHANGLALTRPPGHHATADRAMGFCLYNNVAAAAAALRNQGVPRVAIVDFDVHHGNGTQDIFYADETVFYLSSHQFPHYPGSGTALETGRGPGLGATLNHPLAAGDGDEEFLAAYRDHLLPALYAFEPEFILVSAGFDAHAADPLAGLTVTTDGFTTLVRLLVQAAMTTCGGRIVFSLEGGYDPVVLAACVDETVKVLATADESPDGPT